jgi:glycerophosphoryl diester phosphodiesterase
MTDGTGRIAEHPWSHLRTLRHDSGAPLSTFDAVERATRPLGGHRQHEIKEGVGFSDRHLRHMLAMDVRNVPNAYDRVLYTSSEVETLRRITAVDPRIRVGLITRSDRGRPSLRRLPAWVDVILVDLRAADADYVRRARAAGFEVSMRRVQSAAELHRAAALGATRVVTDRPEELGHAC